MTSTEIDALRAENSELAACLHAALAMNDNLRDELADVTAKFKMLSERVHALSDRNLQLAGERNRAVAAVTQARHERDTARAVAAQAGVG